jgi:hypothetical protein
MALMGKKPQLPMMGVAAKQKLALQPSGKFAPAFKPNMPIVGPIGGKSMPPPNTGGMIATPPPGMGGGMPPPSMGGSQQAAKAYFDANPQRNISEAPPPQMQSKMQIGKVIPALGKMGGTGMKKGGSVKASRMGAVKQSKPSMGSASKRGDGIAQRGKTKGRMV